MNTKKRARKRRAKFRLRSARSRPYLPSSQVRAAVKPGHYVKAVFDDKERMWVEVTEVTKRGWKGILRNQPVTIAGKWGDEATGTWSEILDYGTKSEAER